MRLSNSLSIVSLLSLLQFTSVNRISATVEYVTIVGNSTFTVNKDSNIIVKKDQANITAEHYTITSVKNAKFSCPEKIHINTPVARVSGDCIAGGGGVSLITHNHTQTNGNDLGGGTNTTPSNAGTGVGS